MDVVLNWLWQGMLVALAADVALRAMARSAAQARYAVAWAALLAVLALPAVPFVWEGIRPGLTEAAVASAAPKGPIVSLSAAWWTSPAGPAALWALWFGMNLGRVCTALLALARANERCREIPAGREAGLRNWTRIRGTGRQTRVVMSDSVRAAAVLGFGSPVIAVAPALLDRLGDADLDRVVVHEWAHVQRRDDLANAAQLLVRAIAGWHPAVWWLDRRLHLERETACDEITVALTGSPREYAACLAAIASLPALPIRRQPGLAAASAAGLRTRILRILARRRIVHARVWRAAAVGAAILLVVFALTLGRLRGVGIVAPTSSIAATDMAAPPGALAARAPSEGSPTPVPLVARGPARPAAARRQPQAGGTPTAGQRNEPANAPEASGAALEAPAHAEPPPSADLPPGPLDGLPSSPTPLAELQVPALPPGAISGGPSALEAKSTPWSAAVEAGLAIGRGSERAGVAAAGFFSRLGGRIAGSF